MKTTIRRMLLTVCVLTTTLVLFVTLEHVNAELRPHKRITVYQNLILDQIATGYRSTNLAL